LCNTFLWGRCVEQDCHDDTKYWTSRDKLHEGRRKDLLQRINYAEEDASISMQDMDKKVVEEEMVRQDEFILL